jgi:M6 family metalloprotease-like protein
MESAGAGTTGAMHLRASPVGILATLALLSACAPGDDDEGPPQDFDEDRVVQAHWKFDAAYTEMLRTFGFERTLDRLGIPRYETGFPVPKWQQTLLIHFDGYCWDGWPDDSTLAPAQTWNTLYNTTTGVAARFRDMSHGRFLLHMASVGYACGQFESFFFVPDRDVIDAAITSLASEGFDFSSYDEDGDGKVTPNELAIVVSTNRPGYAATRDGCVQAGSVTQCGNAAVFTVGASVDLMSHELMHVLGAADMYGPWLGSPLHRGATSMSDNRGHVDAWHKFQMGWLRPDLFNMAPWPNATKFVRCAGVDEAEVEGSLLLYDDQRSLQEFFLVEARCNRGSDSTADEGLAIWQVRQNASSDLMNDTRLYGYSVAGCTQNGSAWSCPAPSVCLVDSGPTPNEVNDAPCLETRFVRQADGFVPLRWRDGNDAWTRLRIAAPRYENGVLVGYDVELRSSHPTWTHGFEGWGTQGWWFAGNAGIDFGIGLAHSGGNNAWVRNWQGWNAVNANISTIPGHACSLSAWIRTSPSLSAGYLTVRSWKAGLPIIAESKIVGATSNPEHGNYERVRVDFVADGTNALSYAGFWGNGADAWMQVDDVEVRCD